MSRAGFGTPKYGGNTYKKTGKVGPGENFIRILPPLGSQAGSGTWRAFYVTHWGYSGVNQRDASKPAPRPFRCIRDVDRRTKIVRKECPACVAYAKLEARAEEMKAKLKSEGKSDEQIKTSMKLIEEERRSYRAEAKWYVNVLYKDGKVGDFKLNHKDHMSRIMGIIEGTQAQPGGLLKNEGIDPLHIDQGVWFKITRNGDGITPPDTVELEMVPVPGTKYKEILQAPLTDEQCELAQKECRDITTLGGATLTYDQIAAVVTAVNDPEAIDSIFTHAQATASANAPSSNNTSPPANEDVASDPVSAPSQTYAINGKSATKDQYDRYQKVMAQRKAEEEAKARKKAEEERKAAEEAAAAAAADAAFNIDESIPTPAAEQSDEDFLASWDKP